MGPIAHVHTQQITSVWNLEERESILLIVCMG